MINLGLRVVSAVVRPVAVRDVRRDRGGSTLAFGYALGQPLEPLRGPPRRRSAACPRRLIYTGIPGGVGNRRTPPRFLKPATSRSTEWTAWARQQTFT